MKMPSEILMRINQENKYLAYKRTRLGIFDLFLVTRDIQTDATNSLVSQEGVLCTVIPK
jgi:hypothetical protein